MFEVNFCVHKLMKHFQSSHTSSVLRLYQAACYEAKIEEIRRLGAIENWAQSTWLGLKNEKTDSHKLNPGHLAWTAVAAQARCPGFNSWQVPAFSFLSIFISNVRLTKLQVVWYSCLNAFLLVLICIKCSKEPLYILQKIAALQPSKLKFWTWLIKFCRTTNYQKRFWLVHRVCKLNTSLASFPGSRACTEQTWTLKLILTCHTSCAAIIFPTAACDALQCIADSLGAIQISCTRPPQQCRQLQCDIQNSTIRPFIRAASLTLLLCNQPAALQLVLYNTTEAVIQNETLERTTTILSMGIPLMVTVDHPRNSIGIGVKY